MLIGFIIWTIVSCLFLVIGITNRKADFPVGFFSNVKAPDVTDIKKYNKEVSNIWLVFAILFELLGVPLLFFEQNDPVFIIVILGTVALIIGIIIAYLRVEMKYKK